jgi:multiple sugar transport system permease protein
MQNKDGKKKDFKKYLFLIPALIILVPIVIYPLLYSLLGSFRLFKHGVPVGWIGIENYRVLFADILFYNSLKVTGIFVVSAVFFELIIGFFLAIAINRIKYKKIEEVLRSGFIIPIFIAPVVIGVVWRMLLNPEYGVFNYFLGLKGFSFTGNTSLALPTLIFVDIWQWTPFMFIIFLASLKTMDIELEEAALVDGANTRHLIQYLYIPHLIYPMIVAVLLRIMDAFKLFDTVYTLTFGGPGSATFSTNFTIWRWAFHELKVGKAAAYSWIIVIILSIVFTIFISFIQKRYDLEQL